MPGRLKTLAAYATLAALVLWISPTAVLAADTGSRLEGLVVGIDGRPASGHQIHLIDGDGTDVGLSAIGEDGRYSFKDVPAGEYSLGLELPDGKVAPVAAPPVRVGNGELARRDLKVLQSNRSATDEAVHGNYGLGVWWAGLSAAGKTWTIIAIVVAAYLTFDALDDDENQPQGGGSKFLPGGKS